MLVHLYHPITKEFVGSSFAEPDPADPSNVLYPAFSTKVEPPTVRKHEKALFEPDTKTWFVVSDWRNVPLFRKENGAPVLPLDLCERPDWEIVTDNVPPVLQENQALVWDTYEQQWRIIADFRGKTVFDKTTGIAKSVTEIGPLPDDVTLLPPPPDHRWDKHKWVKDKSKVKERKQNAIKEALKQNDVETVRALREFLIETVKVELNGEPAADLKIRMIERDRVAEELRAKLKEA